MKKVKMKGGLNVPLHGSVNNFNIDSIDTKFSAVLSDDYFGLKPKILIREGDTVNQGDPLLLKIKQIQVFMLDLLFQGS